MSPNEQIHLIEIVLEEGNYQTTDSCDDRKACIAVSFGLYLTELVSTCAPIAEIPWLAGACVVGVTAEYAYNCYNCHETYPCNEAQ